MHVDPAQNVVVFNLAREGHEPAVTHAPTRAEDSVRQAWESVRYEHLARADEVTALYCEWEPSSEDARFIAEHFPMADVKYSFPRPGPGGWDEALDAARHAMRQSAYQATLDQVDSDGELLPVVWSHSSPSSSTSCHTTTSSRMACTSPSPPSHRRHAAPSA